MALSCGEGGSTGTEVVEANTPTELATLDLDGLKTGIYIMELTN